MREFLRWKIREWRPGIVSDGCLRWGRERGRKVHWTVVKRFNVPICENPRTGSCSSDA